MGGGRRSAEGGGVYHFRDLNGLLKELAIPRVYLAGKSDQKKTLELTVLLLDLTT